MKTYATLLEENKALPKKVTSLEEELALSKAKVASLEEKVDVQARKISALEEKALRQDSRIQQLLRQIYGVKSERFVSAPGQLALDLGEEGKQVEGQVAPPELQKIEYTREKKKRTNWDRFTIPEGLHEEIIVIEPEEDVEGWKMIGEEVTKELEYTPGSFFVRKYIRRKYLKPEDKDSITSTIVMGSLPSRPIEKGMPGCELLAYILISKFLDHLPLYRTRRIFRRHGVDIKSSTMNGWVRQVCALLKELYQAMCEHQFNQAYLMADETKIKVIIPELAARNNGGKGKTHTGYFWVYYDPIGKNVVFKYARGRGEQYPMEHLGDFLGKIQADGYAGYNFIEKATNIILLGCMAHARRKFEEAKGNDLVRAEAVLAIMQRLYAVERKAREEGMSAEQRLALRRREAAPIMNELKKYLDEEYPKVLPKSAIGQAIFYTLNRWKYLERYLEDGYVEIDNNLVENAIRLVALGRKNYLFAGSERGAEWAAMLYTIIGSASNHGLNPQEYLKDVLQRLPDTKRSQLYTLFPANWVKQEDLYPATTPADNKTATSGIPA